jgi:HD-like signal output (HDOD) protein
VSGALDLEPLVVDLIKRDAVRVPPYPAVAMRLQKLVNSTDFGIPDLVRVAGEDQVLAATLLRCANSAMYRGLQPATTLQAAISRMGAAEVCRVALALTMGSEAATSGPLSELRRKAWRNGLMSAMICSQLATKRKASADEAFICGLLHDFGRVLAIACFEDILKKTKDARELSEADWATSVDRFHVELGLVTAAKWNLSALLVAVISSHHQPDLAGQHRPMVDIVMASDVVVERLEANPRLSPSDLSDALLKGREEIDFMMNVVQRIPAFISSLDETAAVAEPPSSSKSQVLKPETLLLGAPKTASFSVHLVRTGGGTPYKAAYVTPAGLAFVGKTRLKENNVVRLKLEAGPMPFEVWGNVVLCSPEGAEHRMEAKLFAVDTPTQEAWDRLYGSLT